MKNSYVICALALLILSSCQGDSQCELRLERLQEIRDEKLFIIDPGYVKGGEYLQLDEHTQQSYVDGIVDGMRLAPFLGAYDQTYPESRLRALLYCVASWGDERKNIVDDYFLAHPEKLKGSAHVLIYVALLEACNTVIENCHDATCQGYSKM
jgi:hypothetical protein